MKERDTSIGEGGLQRTGTIASLSTIISTRKEMDFIGQFIQFVRCCVIQSNNKPGGSNNIRERILQICNVCKILESPIR